MLSGWTPITVTRYEYDDAGRMVRSVSVTESEWSAEDRDVLVASQQYARSLNANGIPIDEATDPDNQFAWQGHIITDFSEQSRLDTLERAKAEKPDASFNGKFVRLTRREGSTGLGVGGSSLL